MLSCRCVISGEDKAITVNVAKEYVHSCNDVVENGAANIVNSIELYLNVLSICDAG